MMSEKLCWFSTQRERKCFWKKMFLEKNSQEDKSYCTPYQESQKC